MFAFIVPPYPYGPEQAVVVQTTEGVQMSPEQQLADRARADGWSASQAEWIGKLGAAALSSSGIQGTPTPEAMDAFYREGRRKLAVGYFDDALSRGKSRLVAFLTVVDLEKQVAARRCKPEADYPDDWLKAAYVAVGQAAARGASSAEQVDIGFAEIR